MDDIPFIDPHHHLRDLEENYYPWLSDGVKPSAFGHYPHWHRRDRAAARLGAPELSLIRPHLKKAIKAALGERQLQRNSKRKTICGT